MMQGKEKATYSMLNITRMTCLWYGVCFKQLRSVFWNQSRICLHYQFRFSSTLCKNGRVQSEAKRKTFYRSVYCIICCEKLTMQTKNISIWCKTTVILKWTASHRVKHINKGSAHAGNSKYTGGLCIYINTGTMKGAFLKSGFDHSASSKHDILWD